MKKLLGTILVLALVLSFSVVATTPVAAAVTYYVATTGNDSNDGLSPANAWLTIQHAVTTAGAGDTIEVAAGTYPEGSEMTITQDLTIIGADKTSTIITPTGGFVGFYLFRVNGGQFNLSNVTLDGTGNLYGGVRYTNPGTGTLDNNTLKNIVSPGYMGFGVVVYADNVVISNNTFTTIGRVGVWVGGSNALVTGNTYTGKDTGDWIDYGVEVGMGGVAAITGNTITNCKGVALSDGSGSAAILVTTFYGAGTTATITGNTLTGNTEAIAVGYNTADTSVVTANFNNISGNTYGVYTTSNTVTTDAIHNWWGHASGPSDQGPGSGNSVGTNVDFDPWLMEEDGTETTETDTGSGADASASTTNVEATATGGDATTTVTVGEYVGNPTGASPGFRSGAVYIDVHVGGTLPTELVVEVACPGGICSGVVLQWWDGADWMPVVAPTSVVSGKIQFVLSATSSPTIAQLTGTPFGLGGLSTVGWEGSPVNKAGVIAPWIALMAAMMAGAMLLVLRRRRVQI